MKEQELQYRIRCILRAQRCDWHTTSGVPIAILSIGEWNRQEGPDFLSMAIHVEGRCLIGHGEVHWYASDWTKHNHHRQAQYERVLLHIVVHDDCAPVSFAQYTLVIPEDVIRRYMPVQERGDCTIAVADECVHVVRTYAQRRLLRKASDALIWIRTLGIGMAWHRALEDFIRRRMSRRHMPNSMKRLKQMLASTCGTAIVDDAGHPALWQACSQGNAEQALYEYASILRAAPWGRGTTIEYIVNVLLPLGYALMLNSSKPCQAQYVLDWYWTLPAAQRYAELQRQFPLIEQQYVWQQQGLLEYMRVCTVPYARSTLHAVAAHSSADMVITLFDRV